jgi:hypothetical protein
MKHAAMIAIAITFALPAHAESRKYLTDLIKDRSPGQCDNQPAEYVVDLTAGVLSVSNPAGRQFSMRMPADGTIKKEFKSPTGSRLEFSGNTTAGEYQVYNFNSGCRWRLRPMSQPS